MKSVTLWGLGSMGAGIAKLLRQRGYVLANVWDNDPDKVGRPVGDVIADGGEPGPVVSEANGRYPDAGNVVIIATGSFVDEVYHMILEAVQAGQHVVTIAEEMAFPWAGHAEKADAIDAAAKEQGVAVLGTGINPGFVLDALIGFLSSACLTVDRVYARRVNDLAPFGPTVLRTQGVGTTPEQFAVGVANGSIVGHIGFPESIHLLAQCLGWQIDRIEQDRQPIISTTERSTPYIQIRPGQVAGCNHRAWGYVGSSCVIELEHPQQICPEVEGTATGDHIAITGEPGLTMDIQPEIPGGLGTIAVTVNSIPRLLEAAPGLRTMADLVLPSCGRWQV